MSRPASLPFLPGMSFDRPAGQQRYAKKQTLGFNNGVAGVTNREQPKKVKPKTAASRDGKAAAGDAAPAWLAFDRQVLNFRSYFQEAVHEQRDEQFRVRECKILFYLEDDTIQVVEKKSENSGIPQGTILRRHRVPKPAPREDEFYAVEDFNIGKEITIYGRTYKICDADAFTRNFLTKLGTRVGEACDIPLDPYARARQAIKQAQQPLRPYEKVDKLKKFLEFDGRVLRFYCLWDDSDNDAGDRRYMVLHYFLSDDQVEIKEILKPNSGRDQASVFLRKQPLPKETSNLVMQPGHKTDRTMLNGFGGWQGGHNISDSLRTGAVNTPNYTDADLQIGNVVEVFGRKLLLCDCDDSTKEYYRITYGVDDFTPVSMQEERGVVIQPEIPPPIGIGSEDDSLGSVKSLIPKVPRKRYGKFSSEANDSKALRFSAVLDTDDDINQTRHFVVSFFLVDDTIMVVERNMQNSGVTPGKFIQRRRLKTPEGGDFDPEDFYIGAELELNKFKFILTDADEFTLRFMEDNEFYQCNLTIILDKLHAETEGKEEELGKGFESLDSGSGTVSVKAFSEVLGRFTTLTPHQIITLARTYGSGGNTLAANADVVGSTMKASIYNHKGTMDADGKVTQIPYRELVEELK